MNLNRLIPDSKDHWIIKNNIIYVHYHAKIPIVVVEDEVIWVYIDSKIRKYVLQMVSHLIESNIEFLFRCPSIFFHNHLTDGELSTINLESYMSHLIDDKFYYGFEKMGFDFVENITNYLVKFEAFEVFKPIIDKYKLKASKKEYDYFTNKEIYIINNEEIREFVMSLERDIKLNLLI